MLLDKHDYQKRQFFYQDRGYTTVEDKWAHLPRHQQKAIRLVVENALDASVYASPRNVSSFLLERLGIWVSADEVQGVLRQRSDISSVQQLDRHALLI